MYAARIVDAPRRPVAALEDVIGLPRTTRLLAAAADFRKLASGRVIWNFSSTATGGGVADMLQVLVGYTKDLAIGRSGQRGAMRVRLPDPSGPMALASGSCASGLEASRRQTGVDRL